MQKILSVLTNKERWTSRSTYLFLLAYLSLAFSAFQVHITSEQYHVLENAIKTILDILVFLGILHDSTKR